MIFFFQKWINHFFVQINHVINHMFLANRNKIQIIMCNFYIFNVNSYVFIKKFIINNPQCICKIQPYKWLVVILIRNLPLHFELKKVNEVTYNCMFSFYQNLFVFYELRVFFKKNKEIKISWVPAYCLWYLHAYI